MRAAAWGGREGALFVVGGPFGVPERAPAGVAVLTRLFGERLEARAQRLDLARGSLLPLREVGEDEARAQTAIAATPTTAGPPRRTPVRLTGASSVEPTDLVEPSPSRGTPSRSDQSSSASMPAAGTGLEK